MHSKEQLYEILVNEYVKYFYNFSLSRTTSINDAEDLSQRILLECIDAINKEVDIKNINTYFWSIAHNTYKRYLKEQTNSIVYDNEYCMRIEDTNSVDTDNKNKETAKIRYSLLVFSGMYRKIIVDYYYENMKIKDIAIKYNQSEEMIKWYLQKSKKKLKEIYQMETTFGLKSFNPSEFTIYYSGIDFSKVSVWQLFKRLLPKQIALSCYNESKTISQLSIELGVASCYLEEEIKTLVDAGVILNNGKDRFNTNFLILDKNSLKQIKELYDELYNGYIETCEKVFNENIDRIKNTKMFKQDVDINRYKWIFGDRIADFDSRILLIDDIEYPRILSCGARAFIFGEESNGTIYAAGQTPSKIEKYTLWARDCMALGMCWKNQEIFKNSKYTKIIIDVYNGIINEELKEDYAYLLKEGYLLNVDGKLFSNIPYLGDDFKSIMKEINTKLYDVLEIKSEEIYQKIESLVKKVIPSSLKEYSHGYTFTLIRFYSGIFFMQKQIESGFCRLNKDHSDTLVLNYFTDN